MLAQTMAGHLVHEITVRGAQGGPLTPLAGQLNHDMTHLQGQRLDNVRLVAGVEDPAVVVAEDAVQQHLQRRKTSNAPRWISFM